VVESTCGERVREGFFVLRQAAGEHVVGSEFVDHGFVFLLLECVGGVTVPILSNYLLRGVSRARYFVTRLRVGVSSGCHWRDLVARWRWSRSLLCNLA
jgi:hypothetical protein